MQILSVGKSTKEGRFVGRCDHCEAKVCAMAHEIRRVDCPSMFHDADNYVACPFCTRPIWVKFEWQQIPQPERSPGNWPLMARPEEIELLEKMLR